MDLLKVKHPTLKFMLINKSDFDPEQHELYEEPKPDSEKVTGETDLSTKTTPPEKTTTPKKPTKKEAEKEAE